MIFGGVGEDSGGGGNKTPGIRGVNDGKQEVRGEGVV